MMEISLQIIEREFASTKVLCTCNMIASILEVTKMLPLGKSTDAVLSKNALL